MAETQTDLKRKAAERRERILNSAALRMSRIHGHPVEETVPPDDAVAHEASVETPLHTERPMSGIDVAARYEVASEAKEREKKKQPSSGSPFETAAVVMHVTHRLQILVASLLAVWYAVYGWASSSPLGLLFVSEVTLISGSWMYLALVPSLKTRQIELLRQERRLMRSLGGRWIPNFLYRFHTVAALIRIVSDVHLCFRIVYADVAVFVVLCIALRRIDVLSAGGEL